MNKKKNEEHWIMPYIHTVFIVLFYIFVFFAIGYIGDKLMVGCEDVGSTDHIHYERY